MPFLLGGVNVAVVWAAADAAKRNRKKILHIENKFLGEENENLVVFAKKYVFEHNDIDFLIFGHRHIALDMEIKKDRRVIILGDFVSIFTYGVFDGENFRLEYPD